MTQATRTINGERIRQIAVARIILQSLEEAAWNGRGAKNLHQDIFQARGKAHGSAIHAALADLRKAGEVVMVGQPGDRRTTYYLARYAPKLTAPIGGAEPAPKPERARPKRRPVIEAPAPALDADVIEWMNAPMGPYSDEALTFGDLPVIISDAVPPNTVVVTDGVAAHTFTVPQEPEPLGIEAAATPALPPAVVALADAIAAQVRESVLRLCGDALAQAHEDAAAAQALAEEAERKYNGLRAQVKALAAE